MASDLSSGCTEALGIHDEKEEGEISLEDVSSSEEGHLNYGYGIRPPQCPNCLSVQHCTAWCTASSKFYHSRSQNKRVEVDLILQDAVQGKENRQYVRESGPARTKHVVSTLQEKFDDLVSMSSDSDMEIIGLVDNSKQIIVRTSTKSRAKKKTKKKRSHATLFNVNDLVSLSSVDPSETECTSTLKHNSAMVKSNSLSRSHHREVSPIHKTSRSRLGHRSPPRSRLGQRSPPRSRLGHRSPPRRHRSPVRAHSSFKKSQSSIRTRSPAMRRSPRRTKSPERSPVRSIPRTSSQLELSPTSCSYIDTHKLLKKVRELKSVGTNSIEETLYKNREHASSLKEKLTNMMKGMSDNNGNVTNYSKEMSNVNNKENDDADDEEDLALLRQKALETKQKKLIKQNDPPKIETVSKAPANEDNQDEEDIELRMIALRSAILKKHQNRLQRGLKSGKHKKPTSSRSGSPFAQSFLYSIPIPGEELSNFISPPHTPRHMNENNHTEDTELDMDVEREKEKLPYSPTDKITSSIPMDTELLGIQPSDVSFISLNEANTSPAISGVSSKDEQKSLDGHIVKNRSYLPKVMYYMPSQSSWYEAGNTSVPYSPSDPTGSPGSDFTKKHSRIAVQNYTESCKSMKNNNLNEFVDVNSSHEMPYSPTDTPMYDPDLSQMLPQTPARTTTSNSSLISLGSYNSNAHRNIEEHSEVPINSNTGITKYPSHVQTDEHSHKMKTFFMDSTMASTSISYAEPPAHSMLTIDNLPKAVVTTCSTTDLHNNATSTEFDTGSVSGTVNEAISEPLYMKGVPDITKDVHKIPILSNRTLVPASILKSNKQLQQPLPVKKLKTQPEPTIKPAEMHPVIINNEDNTKLQSLFTPIRLVPLAQKSLSVLTTANAFNDSLQEDSCNETSITESITLSESEICDAACVQTSTTGGKSLHEPCGKAQRRKRRMKKGGLKRRSIKKLETVPQKHSTCLNKEDTDMVTTQTTAVTESTKNNKKNVAAIEVNKENEQNIATEHTTSNIRNGSTNSALQNGIDCETNSSSNTQSKKMDHISSIAEIPQTKASPEKRRQSLDEDIEALRAILLASLPKRPKLTKSDCPNTDTTTTSIVSDSTKQSAPTATSSIVNTINKTNSNNTLLSEQVTNSKNPEHNNNQLRTKVIETTTTRDLSNRNVETTLPLVSGRKRPIFTSNKVIQKKHIRKISIPASTKVVNNAKKYQNAIVQKRLSLQKTTTLYPNQTLMENKGISKPQLSENKWSSNTKTSLASDTPRIVISLGSDTESDSEFEQDKNKTTSSTNSSGVEKNQSSTNSTTDFEKNLEQFLRDARKKQESVAATRPILGPQTTKKDIIAVTQIEKTNSSTLHTPLAVRHLPASQQEEYRRLKQQILEREKLRLHRLESNNSSKNKITGTPLKPVPSKNANKDLPTSRISQINPVKPPTATSQQMNRESTSKHSDSTKNVPNSSTIGDTSLFQTKTVPKPLSNLTIQMPNENISSSPSAAGKRIVEDSFSSLSTSSTVSENGKFTQEVSATNKKLPCLKVLSKEKINQKYVQIQEKRDMSGRDVTINDTATSIEKIGVDQDQKTTRSKQMNEQDMCEQDINYLVQNMEKEITSNETEIVSSETIDSDASTIILSGRDKNREDNSDITESTITLSQYQEENQASIFTNSEVHSSINSLLPKKLSECKESIDENWETTKKDVKTELCVLNNLSDIEQKRHLIDTEQKLVMERYTILDELAEMSSNLREWHMERDLQTNLVAEVKKLREQLKLAEERLQLQRNRINSIGPKVVVAHKKINTRRKECFKLSKICSVLGARIVGNEYKVPEAGAQLLDNKLKEVANHTRELSRKKVPSIDIPEMSVSVLPPLKSCEIPTEIIQTEECFSSEENIIPNSDATAISENLCSVESGELEEALESQSSIANLNQITEQEDNVITNVSVVHEDSESLSKQDTDSVNTQPEFSSTPIVAKESRNLQSEQVLENTKAGPPTKTCINTNTFEKQKIQQRTKKALLPYVSILTHFKEQRNTNPNGILCPYELMGTCNDGDCQYVHHSETQAK